MIESEGFSHFWTFGESLAIPEEFGTSMLIGMLAPTYGYGGSDRQAL